MVTHFIQSIFSYSGNVMLAAIISLLLVILFVLLLHLYAKWFLAQARRRRPQPTSGVLRPSRFHHFHSSVITFENPLSKGLDASVISSIPLFVYRTEKFENLECIICLSGFGEGQAGRNLPKCKHCFHVECIDMWLHSHSSCPICRAPVVVEIGESVESDGNSSMDGVDGELLESESEIVIDVVSSDSGIANESKCLSEDEMAAAEALGCSLKRMLSRNVSECKVHPSSCANGLEA